MGDANRPLVGTSETRAIPAKEGVCAGRPQHRERLLLRDEVLSYLRLSDENVQQLINTRQITLIRITGEERFDLHDLDHLIDSYKSTASRRPL
jgi:hypothetical protein